MGLDMYLNKRKFVKSYKANKGEGLINADKITITTNVHYANGTTDTSVDTVDNPSSSVMIDIPYCYWRKVNCVHKWFLDATNQEEDVCQEIEVSGELLMDLVDRCKRVLDNHTLASTLLPTQEGFFFGSTEYDEYYFDDLKDTLTQLKDVDPKEYYVYHASW